MRKKIMFVLLTIVSLGLISLGFYLVDHISEKTNEKEKIEEKEQEKEENQQKDPYQQYRKYPNFQLENYNRYIAYQDKNPTLTMKQAITHVNIGLDQPFYTSIKKADTSNPILVLVNKYLKLDNTYEPDDLEEISQECFINGNLYVRQMKKEAKEQFEKLCHDAKENNTPVYGQSGYRPYTQQEKLYKNAVSQMGQEKADNDTARPGHSEHQTGLTIDVSSTKNGNMLSFGNTSSYQWMQNHAHEYGFILRYPEGYETIHGFMYESWHYRYIGIEKATDMHENYPDLTYDEYYDQVIAPKKMQ